MQVIDLRPPPAAPPPGVAARILRRWRALLVGALVVGLLGLLIVGEAPPQVFGERTFAGAQATLAPGELMIVSASATWCPSCRAMDRGAWRDPAVIAWIEAHGPAVRVDIDREPELASRLQVRSVPTILVLSGDGPLLVGRSTGSMSAPQLLAWLGARAAAAQASRTAPSASR